MKYNEDSVLKVLAPIMQEYKLSCITVNYEAGGDSYDGYRMHYTPAQEDSKLDDASIASAIEARSISTMEFSFMTDFINETAPEGFEINEGSDGKISLMYNQQEDKFMLRHDNTALIEQSLSQAGTFSASDISDFDAKFVSKMADVLTAQKITTMDIHVSDIDSDGDLVFNTSIPLKNITDADVINAFIRAVLRNGMGDDYDLDPEKMNGMAINITINIKLDKQNSAPRVQYSIDIERDPTYDAPVTCFQKSYTGASVDKLLKDDVQPSKPKSGVKP